jgi:CMP-N-acetylneuraminic acid synthetase
MRTGGYIAMIPARIGSTRLKMKNLALIDGRPMISYAIEAAVKSGVFSRVVVNSEHPIFDEIAKRYGAEFYLRSQDLGSSEAKSDQVVYDFMKSHPAEGVAWVNPISPLQNAEEVARVINHFRTEKLDSLITTHSDQVHCNYDGNPLNYNLAGLFAKTQDLVPIERFVYSIMMWRNTPFIQDYEKQGYALFCGQFGTCEVSESAAIMIKREADLLLADALIRGMRESKPLEYDPVAKSAMMEESI